MIISSTNRLILREAKFNDASFIFELLNNPTWIEHIGNRNIKNLKDAKSYIQKALIDSYELHGFGMYIMTLKESGKPLGLCGLLKRENLEHYDIGFAILPAYAGKGYTFEAGQLVIEQAYTDFGIETVYGITYDGNIASQKLLEKLGLKHIKNIKFGDYDEESMLFSNESRI